MSQENWFTAFDWKCLFPVEFTDSEGNVWNCDSDDECWIYFEDSHEACDDSWNCYSPEEAIAVYFGEEDLSWSEADYCDFNYDDWKSNFDMSQENWSETFNFECVLSNSFEDAEGLSWLCDDEEKCYTDVEG